MLKSTKEKMIAYALTLKPSCARAECINISSLALGDMTISEAMVNDHCDTSHAYLAAVLMLYAGAATSKGSNPFNQGTITFEDGSQLKLMNI